LSPKDEKLLTKDKCDPVTFAPRCAGINLIISPPPSSVLQKEKKKGTKAQKKTKKEKKVRKRGV
jgi:hypothetical protein